MELKIRILREDAGFSQEVMADKMGLSQSAYARFELSKTKIDLNRLSCFASQIGKSLIDVIAYPERYVNVDNIHKEIKNLEPDVTVQIKVIGNKRENILKTIFGDSDLELLSK